MLSRMLFNLSQVILPQYILESLYLNKVCYMHAYFYENFN